jgi:hypothetical protein
MMRDENFARNDAYAAAQRAAVTGAGEEVARQGQMELANRGQLFGERAKNSDLSLAGQTANAQDAREVNSFNFNKLLEARQQGAGEANSNAQLANAVRGNLFNEGTTQFGQDLAANNQNFGQQAAAASQNFGQEAAASNQNFNQGLTSANYGNTLRQQQIAEEMMRRGYTLNEINAILTGQQVGMPQMPSFNTASKADTTNYLGAAQMQGQSQLDAFNAENAGVNGLMSGVGSLAKAWKPFGF